MKNFALAALLALSSLVAFGNTLTVVSASGQSDQWNSVGANVAVLNYPIWTMPYSGSEWVSYTETGYEGQPGYVSVSVGTEVTFTHVFFVQGTPSGGTLKIMAADTARIKLNGATLQNFDTSFGSGYYGCGDTFGCRFNTEASLSLTSTQLHAGFNKLEVTVKKGMVTALNGFKTGFGVDYKLTAEYSPSCQ